MPTYEYSCLDCSHEYEKREGFEAPALQQCPSCGGTARRVIHAAPIVFKGSGFYITDNRKSAPEAEAEAKTGDSASKPATAGRDAEPAAAS
ncbi:MAG: hypothetical protein A2148_07235 [Chloroflexi bacterium RBG_16_68_14]|nr:MAG: hypothetical protein A2148_07235 [Chloroflexi bacterium RBG_16_68_14]